MRGWECERVGHLKISFDIRSHGPAEPQTSYRDPVKGIRRIGVKGRKKGATIRLTVNEGDRASHLGDGYSLYVVWNPLNLPAPQSGAAPQAGNPFENLACVPNPAQQLDHAKKEVVAARYFDILADAIEPAANKLTCT